MVLRSSEVEEVEVVTRLHEENRHAAARLSTAVRLVRRFIN
jgi:hypothetical protein